MFNYKDVSATDEKQAAVAVKDEELINQKGQLDSFFGKLSEQDQEYLVECAPSVFNEESFIHQSSKSILDSVVSPQLSVISRSPGVKELAAAQRRTPKKEDSAGDAK